MLGARRRGWVRTVMVAAAWVVGLLVTTMLLFAALVVVWLARMTEDIEDLDARSATQVGSAPLPAGTCSGIAALSRDSSDFLQLVLYSAPHQGETMSRREWRSVATDMGAALERVDKSARAVERAVPERMREHVRELIRQVDVGLAELPYAAGPGDYDARVGDALAEGVVALVNADAVLGDACGTLSLVPVLDAGTDAA